MQLVFVTYCIFNAEVVVFTLNFNALPGTQLFMLRDTFCNISAL